MIRIRGGATRRSTNGSALLEIPSRGLDQSERVGDYVRLVFISGANGVKLGCDESGRGGDIRIVVRFTRFASP